MNKALAERCGSEMSFSSSDEDDDDDKSVSLVDEEDDEEALELAIKMSLDGLKDDVLARASTSAPAVLRPLQVSTRAQSALDCTRGYFFVGEGSEESKQEE